MKKFLIALFLILLVTVCVAGYAHAASSHEVGVRYGNYFNTQNFFSLDLNTPGKMVEGTYQFSPWSDAANWLKSFYVEGAAGAHFDQDFLNSNVSFVGEISPGLQVHAGPVVAKISQGIALMPGAPSGAVQFPTHLSLGLQDVQSGVSVALERSHYSSGSANGMDMTGITVGFKF